MAAHTGDVVIAEAYRWIDLVLQLFAGAEKLKTGDEFDIIGMACGHMKPRRHQAC